MYKLNIQEENVEHKFHDIGFGNDFLDVTPKEQATKEKIDKLNLMKIKYLLCVKR